MSSKVQPDLSFRVLAAAVLAWGGVGPAWALPLSVPPVGRYTCLVGDKGWFQAGMAPVFTLEVLPSSRFRIETRKGGGGEGPIDAKAWPAERDAAFNGLFDKGAAVTLMQDDRQPVVVGLYGERGTARTWLLRTQSGNGAYVRCGDVPAGAPKPEAATAPAAPDAPRGTGKHGADFPTPPVSLPAGARLGGEFEPGRYTCVTTMPGYTSRPLDYEFYPNGQWRHPGSRENDGRYVTRPRTGRFDAYDHNLGNNLYHPDEEYTVYFRGASGVSHLYGHKESGTTLSETRCQRTGPVQEASPEEVGRREQANKDAAKARRAAEAAARGERNLKPPPPGNTRWTGLYADETFHQQQRLDPGPYGGFSRLVNDVWSTWEYLDFQADGHVYLGLRNPQEPCDRPSVGSDGEPLCTTYSVDGGRLRIGHEDRGPVSRTANGLTVAKKSYMAVPPLTPRRLAGSYEAASCHGALCEKSTWVFGADGTFGAYGINQGFGTGAGPAGLPMPRGWTDTKKVEGRYVIEGQGLRVTYSDGQTGSVSVFLYPPKDRTLRIGGREFNRK